MNILIANDDGVLAPSIQALAQALKHLGRVVGVLLKVKKVDFPVH